MPQVSPTSTCCPDLVWGGVRPGGRHRNGSGLGTGSLLPAPLPPVPFHLSCTYSPSCTQLPALPSPKPSISVLHPTLPQAHPLPRARLLPYAISIPSPPSPPNCPAPTIASPLPCPHLPWFHPQSLLPAHLRQPPRAHTFKMGCRETPLVWLFKEMHFLG